MADDIHTIDFTHVTMTNGHGGTGTFSDVKITIDYTTHTVTGDVIFTGNGVHDHVFTNLHLINSANGHFGIYSGTLQDPGLRLDWTGHAPTSFNSGVVLVGNPPGNQFSHFTHNTITPGICFAAGTLIRTPAGDVPVETLKAGDVVLTASGAMRPVKWMGHTDVDFRRTPRGGPDFRSGSSPTRSARPGLRRTFTCPPAIRSASISSAKS